MTWRNSIPVILLFLLAFSAIAFVQGFDTGEVDRLVDVLSLDEGDVLADVGAGDGKWSVALAGRVGNAGRVFATEVDPNDLKKIRERVAREAPETVIVIEGGQSDTGLPSACCDAILLRRVYHHFQKPAAMRQSLRQALKPDGLLLIVDFDTHRGWSRPQGIPESRQGHGIDQEMIVSEMEADGFELVSEMDWRGNDYALLFRATARQ